MEDERTLASTCGRFSVLSASVCDYSDDGVEAEEEREMIKPSYSTILDPYNPVDKWIIRLRQEVAFNEAIEINVVDALELIGILWNYKRLDREKRGVGND